MPRPSPIELVPPELNADEKLHVYRLRRCEPITRVAIGHLTEFFESRAQARAAALVRRRRHRRRPPKA